MSDTKNTYTDITIEAKWGMGDLLGNRAQWGIGYTKYLKTPIEIIGKSVNLKESSSFRGIIFNDSAVGIPTEQDRAYLSLILAPSSVREDFLLVATKQIHKDQLEALETSNDEAVELYRIQQGWMKLAEEQAKSMEYTQYWNKESFRKLLEFLPQDNPHDINLPEVVVDDPNVFEEILYDNYPDYYTTMIEMGYGKEDIPSDPMDLSENFKKAFDRVTLRIDLKQKSSLFRSDRAQDKKVAQGLLRDRYEKKGSPYRGIFTGLAIDDIIETKDQLPSWLNDGIVEALEAQKKKAANRVETERKQIEQS